MAASEKNVATVSKDSKSKDLIGLCRRKEHCQIGNGMAEARAGMQQESKGMCRDVQPSQKK
jgi:hypothetical protein